MSKVRTDPIFIFFDIGRFLQPDPIGFGGDATNLYRYCRNNPVKWSDPSGLQTITQQYQNSESDYPGVVVRGPPVDLTSMGGGDWEPAGSGGPGGGWNFGTFSSWGGSGGGIWGGGFHLPRLNMFTSQDPFRDNPFAPATTFSLIPPPLNPPVPSNVPQSVGYMLSVGADAGFVEGMTASYSVAFGDFGSDSGAPNYSTFQSYGGFWGGPTEAARIVDSGQTNFVVGGAVGLSGGFWFSNATSASNVMGPFSGYFVATPWGNGSLSVSNDGYYILTVTFPGSGLSISGYTTDTTPVGGRR